MLGGSDTMQLQMVGVDYEKANLATREVFSFHEHSAVDAMRRIQKKFCIHGVVLISTCNRTELYASVEKERSSLFDLLCFAANVSPEDYHEYAVERKGAEAADHLFWLACGLKSKVFGEDQIITQVKSALSQAREAQTTDSYLEKVFQTAIATAKRVKTKVHLTAVKTSVIEEMLTVLNRDLGSVAGKKCLVIGNGEMGRLAATRMVKEKAQVTMTIRNYKTRDVKIPAGCASIDYKERYDNLVDYDMVVSATTSPHHTIKYEDVHMLLKDGRHRIFVDLAVPRDISSQLEEMESVTLYNIDALGGQAKNEQDNEAMAQAISMIKEAEEELKSWDDFRTYVPAIQAIGHAGGFLTYKRMEKEAKKMVEESKQQELERMVRTAAEKTICSMLFELRKNLPQEYWKACMEAIEKDMIEQHK